MKITILLLLICFYISVEGQDSSLSKWLNNLDGTSVTGRTDTPYTITTATALHFDNIFIDSNVGNGSVRTINHSGIQEFKPLIDSIGVESDTSLIKRFTIYKINSLYKADKFNKQNK